MSRQDQINEFKKIVIRNCENPGFKFREFFIRDHLLIVEKIASELCDIYKEADRDLVSALVWFHDFGKPIDINNESEITLRQGVKIMKSVGLSDDFINKTVVCWGRMEMKNEIDLSLEPIEVKIISSADGASHFVGKFFSTYFKDDASETIEETEKRISKKINQDWERKIVIPELKVAFKERYLRALEIIGEYPEKLINI